MNAGKYPRMKPDFTIGLRGDEWMAFYNTRKALDFIRERGMPHDHDMAHLITTLELDGFTWEREPQ